MISSLCKKVTAIESLAFSSGIVNLAAQLLIGIHGLLPHLNWTAQTLAFLRKWPQFVRVLLLPRLLLLLYVIPRNQATVCFHDGVLKKFVGRWAIRRQLTPRATIISILLRAGLLLLLIALFSLKEHNLFARCRILLVLDDALVFGVCQLFLTTGRFLVFEPI